MQTLLAFYKYQYIHISHVEETYPHIRRNLLNCHNCLYDFDSPELCTSAGKHNSINQRIRMIVYPCTAVNFERFIYRTNIKIGSVQEYFRGLFYLGT